MVNIMESLDIDVSLERINWWQPILIRNNTDKNLTP